MKRVYELDMEGGDGSGVKLFRRQRAALQEIISSGSDLDLLTDEQAETLTGIQNLLDEIADQMKDNYGLDALISIDEGSADTTTISTYNPETDAVEQVDPEQFEAWQQEVSEANTVLGFMEWREHQVEQMQDDKEATP